MLFTLFAIRALRSGLPEVHHVTERWATFDCYGTLIDWDGGVSATLRRLWPDAEVSRLLAQYHAVEPLVQKGRFLSYREVLTRSLRAVAGIEGLPLAAADAAALADSLPEWPVFPDVPAALRELRDVGWRIAILSNTDPDLLAGSLERIGVPADITVTVAEAHSYKPAHGHWQQFFKQTGADRARHVHIAQSLFHDIAPAHDLGLRAVWINRGDETSSLPRAAELPDLHELPVTLQRLVNDE